MVSTHGKLVIGTHFFKILHPDDRLKDIIYKFLKNYLKTGLEKIPRTNRYRKVVTSVYAARTQDCNEFRFHINQYEKFIQLMEANLVPKDCLDIVTLDVPEADPLDCSIKDTWVPRADQEPVVDYLVNSKFRSKLVGIQTGKGKSFLSMYAASKFNKKIAIVVRPMFIYKWVGDVAKYLNIDTATEVMVIQGLSQLMAVFEQQKQGLLDNIKIFIFSNKTLQLWFKQYREYGELIRDQGYGITPEEMYGHLKIGLRLIDEVHLDFHLNFIIDLYTNISSSISLSATLDNKDQFLRDMYELAYPMSQRFKEQEIDKYAIARCIIYSIDDKPEKIRSTEYGSKSYSHNAFEEYIMMRPKKLENYLKLIKHAVDVSFMQDYVKGERCVIFAYRKDFCAITVEYLKQVYPNLDIRRYVAEDPDENMYDPDIRVTTLGSGSTGHDIAMLKAAIMTVNVESIQANVQAFGRLRKLDNLTPRFIYFTCLDVPKHMQYHKMKVEILQKRALNFNIFQSPIRI